MESILGHDTTYSTDLQKVAKRLIGDKFKGVSPSDKIPKMNDGDFAIVNIDKSYEPGSHWLGLYKKKDFWTYDSFGRDANKFLPMKTKNTDRDAEQKITENNCGARALAWLYFVKVFGIEAGELI